MIDLIYKMMRITAKSIQQTFPIGGVGVGLLIAVMGLSSCSDFLEESSQDTDYVRSWDDLDELLIGDCYMTVNGSYGFYSSGSNNYGSCLHLIADEVEEISTKINDAQDFDNHESEFGYYTWQQRTGQDETYTSFGSEDTDWTKVYKCINVANNVLNSADKINDGSDGIHKVKGEAYFLRGYYYFWLVNMFGKPYDPQTAASDLGVPLKTSEEVLDQKFTRNTVQECYDQILSDLNTAEQELKTYGKLQKSIYRADSVTVQMLLSRVYLYMQNWQKAAEYAQKVITAHPALQNLCTNSSSIASKSCSENIFSMGGSDVAIMLFDGIKGLSISKGLYSSFTTNDLRKSQWIWKYGNFYGLTKQAEGQRTESVARTDKNYYYQKYNDGQLYQQAEVSSIFLLRSAEAYVNLAEAEVYLGNTDAAKAAILKLMTARYNTGAGELNIASKSNDDLITLIRSERRKEFMFEGQRWFDLRRYRVCSASPSKISITHDYTYYQDRTSTTKTETHRFVLAEDDASWTLPIPHEVIEFNTGMKNNDNQWREYTVEN